MRNLASMTRRVCAMAFLSVMALCASVRAEESKPSAELKPLVERLGYPAGSRLLILNGDDTGMNHGTNVGTFAAMKAGGLTSATIMMPCSWVPEVVKWAKANPQSNFGLHLTLTSEWGGYKWRPVAGQSAVPSIVDEFGFFFTDVPRVYLKGRLEEVEIEVRAQIDLAYKMGLDVTHIDSHMGTLQYNPKYHELYIRMAKEYNLPMRIAGMDLMGPRGGEYLIKMADELGVLHPDQLYMDGPPKPEETEAFWKKRLTEIPAGKVSEIYIHAGMETDEMKATSGSWRTRSADAAYYATQGWLDVIKAEGIHLISYRELRELQRTGKPLPRKDFYGW